jgi:hypothetical protein
MANNAFLTNANVPLGTEFEDGVRVGPSLDRIVQSTAGYQAYTYGQWGIGMLDAPVNAYNIIPRGPSTAGNVVVAIRPTAAGNLTLAQDSYITTTVIAGESSLQSTVTYLQLDWPRALSITVAGGNFTSSGTLTVFGADYYGVKMQEAITFQNAGTYQLKKAFYQVTSAYYNGADSGGATLSIQTTDVFGLPYKVKSSGDIVAINWGNTSDLSLGFNHNPVMGTVTLSGGATTSVGCSAVTELSNIQLTYNEITGTGTPGILSVPDSARALFGGFVINSTGTTDDSTVDWMVTNPNGQYTASGAASGPMAGGTVTIYTSQVQANSIIHLTLNTFGTAHGAWRVSTIVPGVSFTVTSTEVTETSTVNWAIMSSKWASGTSANLGSTGTIFVPTTQVQANSKILLTYNDISGTPGVLSVPDADINTDPYDPIENPTGPGFVIRSSSALDTSTVNWTIAQFTPALTQGTATLVAGTVTVATTSVAANSVILLTYNTLDTPAPYVEVSAIAAGTSFTITASVNTDVSTINWFIFPANYILSPILTTLGTFTAADENTATNFTGDVRGTYHPSTPSNGLNQLHFIAYQSGFDNVINQQAAVGQIMPGTNIPVGLPRGGIPTDQKTAVPIVINDQVGVMQYYTGVKA